jgi:hypothetical protein
LRDLLILVFGFLFIGFIALLTAGIFLAGSHASSERASTPHAAAVNAVSAKSDSAPVKPKPFTTPLPPGYTPFACLDESPRRTEIVSSHLMAITGSITNTCGRSFSYVAISFHVLDGSGSIIGSAIANVATLQAGETWKFRALGPVGADQRVKLIAF